MAIPDGFVASGPIHRVRVAAADTAYGTLVGRQAILRAESYGSFELLVVDARRVGGLAGLAAMGVELADDLTLVNFNGYLLDGADAVSTATTLATIPADLRADSGAPSGNAHHLRVVQFAGPIKDAWLDELRSTGATIVSYVPNDAYVVRTDAAADEAVTGLRARPFVLGVSSYEPAYKLRPELRSPQIDYSQFYPVTVQIIADAEGAAFASEILDRAVEVMAQPNRVLGYINVGLRLDGANVIELARDSRVFAVEPLSPARLLDERQGMIQAGQLNAGGTGPASATYFSWLSSLGFPGANPFPFVVDVTDDGVDRGSLTDVNDEFKVNGQSAGASRVAYNNNYSGDPLADGRAGHGNLNTSIIGGYNSSTGSAFEDAGAYNYGLGVAPWVKLGNSKVFSNSGAGVFNQPTLTRMSNAYAGGARISSNSWGFTSGTTYNTDSQAHDIAVRDAQSGTAGNQELAIIFAAGNSGPGASTVHPPGTAKNVITVGASENDRQTGSDGCGIANSGADNARDMISFSSRGPTSDARKKPEISSVGTHVEGAASRATGYDGTGVCNQFFPTGQTLYAWSSGTSHSTPAIAGACALVRQFFANTGLGTPSPAMLKAWLCGTATYMTGVGANDTLWSNSQGMGRANLGMSFDSAARVLVDQSQVLGASGATYSVAGNIANAGQPFRVALAWSDAPGPTTGNAFVNNLDLEVTVNGTLFLGNVFSGANSIAGGAADPRNNLESVFLPAGTSGSFSVTVRATNIAGDGVPGNADATDQDFALLIYNGTTSVPTPDFSIAAAPGSQTVTAGNSTNYNVTSNALNGFGGNITLSASPAISGVSYSFVPNPIAAGGGSTLNVNTTTGAPPGTYSITITGTSGALIHNTGVSLTINPVVVADFSISASPPAATITAGGSTNFNVSSTAINGFAGNITLSASPAISGVSYTFSPNPIAAGGSSTLMINTTTGASTGTFPISITGTSGALVHNTGVSLTINPAGGGGNPVRSFALAPNLPIPDNNATGVTSTVNVPDSLTVSSISVGTTIPHTFKGDLVVTLIGPDGTSALLHNRTGGSTDNVTTTFSIATAAAQSLSVFNGKNTAGGWSLKVQDLAGADIGTLSAWTITFNGEQSLTPNLAIPDNNATGVTSTMNYAQTGTVASVKVRVNITHTYQGDLVVTLIAPDGTSVLLHNRTGGTTDNINTEYPDLTAPAGSLAALNGRAINGAWKLKVQDLAAVDTGTLVSWTLSLGAQ